MVRDVHDEGESERLEERLDEQELASFPASDSHSDWAGPPAWAVSVQQRRHSDIG
jgi:hypothetical protein